MRLPLILGALCCTVTNAGAAPSDRATNANHIFNAVHSSMRQWGSSVLHNGMSAFIATVPGGTQLYHGTSKSSRVNGTEWLAFEPEHALVFARSRRGPPPGHYGPPKPAYQGDDDEWQPPQSLKYDQNYPPLVAEPPKHELKARQPSPDRRERDRQLSHTMLQRERAAHNYQTLASRDGPLREDAYGYLQKYRTKHDLRLLYLDGESAAKSEKGTLDLEDMVLLHDNPPPKDGGRRTQPHGEQEYSRDHKPTGGPMGEIWRAEHLCEMAEQRWKRRIDGFLRMEMGFEIILCAFEDHLDVERITQADSSNHAGPPGFGSGSIDYYKAVASRFDGIGGGRVAVDYDNFVSMFSFEGAIYFDEDGRPRVNNNTAVLRPARSAIDDLALHGKTKDSTNWQSATDMVVARYADRIESLASGTIDRLPAFRTELEQAMKPFIDYGQRNRTAEVQRCATQYLPLKTDSVAGNAILEVTTTLCSSLLDTARLDNLEDAVSMIRSLEHWLGWTTFKRCRGCSYDEVCFVPIWPMGGEEDMKQPRCVSNMSHTSRGYWGPMGGPPLHECSGKRQFA